MSYISQQKEEESARETERKETETVRETGKESCVSEGRMRLPVGPQH